MTAPIKPGDKLYRPVTFIPRVTERLGRVIYPHIKTPNFIKTARNQTVVQAQKWKDCWVANGSSERGFVVFVDGDLPLLWTYIEVTSIGAGGKVAFGKACSSSEAELLGMFRR
jgi:hypothetical protein